MLSLRHPYISVAKRGAPSYGGGQQFSPNAMIRRCGCGIVAATDLLLYLSRWHMDRNLAFFDGLPSDGPLPFPAYTDCLSRMNRMYFPMIPYAGINGVMLMAGMLRCFNDFGMPYTARWCFAHGKLWDRMAAMLREDTPVILSVGPNFPKIWGKRRVRFYIMDGSGGFIPTSGARAHYFTVTGLDEEWMRISSWGRCYYVNIQEFEDYARHDSLSFVSNLLLVERKT